MSRRLPRLLPLRFVLVLAPVVATAFVAVLAVRAEPPAASPAVAREPDPRERHLANLRQLTFGGQNAEAYWSSDAKRLVFQSTRDDLQADQIFTMNADGSDVRRISPGTGR